MPDPRPIEPPWLKAMQNGALGEARARAFLLERFWVLERSADIDGADLIIQRRLTSRNLLDRDAPRLGVVQVKFFGTPATHHLVRSAYVLDDAGSPRAEFFVLCCTGLEDNSRMFIIPGRDLSTACTLGGRDGNEGYVISQSTLSEHREFEVTNRKRALDRIEHQLELAEFTTNRRFLSWVLPSASLASGAIEPLYREPIDNWWGDIPEGFERIKKTAQRALFDVEEIHELLLQLTQQTDPLAAEDIADTIASQCDAHGRWSIRVSDRLRDSEFFRVCRTHKLMVDRLRADGLLDAFLTMKERLRNDICAFLESHLPLNRDFVHRFTLRYDSASLTVIGITSTVLDIDALTAAEAAAVRNGPFDSTSMELAEPGCIVYRWAPGQYGPRPETGPTTAEFFRTTDFLMYYSVLSAVFAQKYGAAGL